ncbi:MAG: hypothetical protein ACR2F6_10185, partial [Mycobacteriales bacterium]
PRHNFTSLPPIRSERPAFELHYPQMIERMAAEAYVGPGSQKHNDHMLAQVTAHREQLELRAHLQDQASDRS